MAELMQRFRVPGASVAVIRDFDIHWAKGYGVADGETTRGVETTTPFQAASISKPVAAMAAMRLVQEGRLALDGDINVALKSWRVPASDHTRLAPVTPRSLMSHTSGADDGFGFPGYDPGTPLPTPAQILDGAKPSNVGRVTFARQPFAGYKYSGGGVTLMQLAMEDVTGRPFAEFMRATVLAPLGMADSSYVQPPAADYAARVARAHDGQGRRSAAPFHVYPEQAAAGLWTTPADLAKFAIEVQKAVRGPRGAVIDQASAREMTAPVGTGPFAVGFTIERNGEGWYFSHGGSNWGFRAHLVAHVRKGYGLAIMTNGDAGNGLIAEVRDRVAAAYGWDSLDKPIPR
jgi:CubicO group peptidase (beta-lactamase class C family)